MSDAPQTAAILAALHDILPTLGYTPPAKIDLREIPFEGAAGFGTPLLLALAGQVRDQHPGASNPEIAQRIGADLIAALAGRPEVGRVEVAANGFLNFIFPRGDLLAQTLQRILQEGAAYGHATTRQPGRVMVEYSQPNTHKGFHIGHMRNVALGMALVNIYRAAGFDTIPANYYGDIGTHVIKCLWGYQRFYRGQEPPKRRGTFLGEVYTFAESKYAASEELKAEALKWMQDLTKMPATRAEAEMGKRLLNHLSAERISLAPTLGKRELWTNITRAMTYLFTQLPLIDEEDAALLQIAAQRFDPTTPAWQYGFEVLDTFAQWEAHAPALVSLWEETREWSLAEFREIYQQLGAQFEVDFYESEEEEPGKAYVRELVEQGVAVQDQGALIVRIDALLAARGLQEPDKERYRTLIVLRADGSSLYSTKDLSLARKKFQDHGITRSVYVVADEQAFYFQQIFKILELAGFEQARDCFHLSYGLVTLPEGKMSSRKGNVVLYFDFVKEMLDAAWRIVKEKQPELGDAARAQIARQVAFGAMKYDMLKVDATRTIVFDRDEALSFEGRTAPYIQYAHARACRILEKAASELEATPDPSHLGNAGEIGQEELELAKKLGHLGDVIQKAAGENNPLPVATYVYEVAQEFNDFYQKVPVLKAEDPAALNTRLCLVQATRQVLANGLALLGIDAPVVM